MCVLDYVSSQYSNAPTQTYSEMTMNLIHMANNLDSSTNSESLNYVLLGRPHKDKYGGNHPTYMEMIKGAIEAMNNGRGSSKAAILKYIAQNYHVGENLPKVNSHLRVVLKKAIDCGDIEQSRGHGASGSFRMGNKREKMLQVGIPMRSTPIMMLKEITKKADSIPSMKQSKAPKQIGKMEKGKGKKKMMGKKRIPMKNKKVMKKKNMGGMMKDKQPKHKREEGPATIKMELRTGTRKSYAP